MSMIERVARAIATAREQNGGPPFEAYDAKYNRPALFDEARAAIAAMREPTEAMEDAAYKADGTNMMLAIGYDEVWRAMIDAALNASD